MTIAKRLCVLGLIFTPIVGFLTFIGIGFGCALDNLFAAWLLIQTLFTVAFLVMLVGYNMKDGGRGQKVCVAGVLLFALAMASTAWGFNYKFNGVWRPYADLQTVQVLSVQLDNDKGQALADEDAKQVLELMQQVKLRNPAIDGDWVPYPEDALGERGRFLVRLADDKAYSLGVIDNYYFRGGCCYEAANPEVGMALQSLYAELIVKYTPEGDEAQLAAER